MIALAVPYDPYSVLINTDINMELRVKRMDNDRSVQH
jgi:hypothetical protein